MANGETKKSTEDKIIYIKEAIKEGEKKISELNKAHFDTTAYFEYKNKKLEKKLIEIEEKAGQNQMRLVEALGIFVALFTFISVNVQIFNKLTNIQTAIGFMLAMGGITITILLVVEILIRTHIKQKAPKWHIIIIGLIAVIQIIIGVIFTSDSPIPIENQNDSITIDANIKTDQNILTNTLIKKIKE